MGRPEVGIHYHRLLAACLLGALMLVTATGRIQEHPQQDGPSSGPDTASLPTICTEEQGCKCTRTAAGDWVSVNCSCIKGQNLLNVRAEQLPLELEELEVRGCQEVFVHPGSLSNQRHLKRVRVAGVGSFTINRRAFDNSSASTLLQVDNCKTVVIENAAWQNTSGPHAVTLDRCGHVVISPWSFSGLQTFRARHIARLDLQKHAFSLKRAPVNHFAPATNITIEDSMLPEIPNSAFPSSAAELKLERCRISVMRKDAFCGLSIKSLILRDCALGTVEQGAFSGRTLVDKLLLEDLSNATFLRGAVQSAVTKLIIQHSRFHRISEGAFNMTVVSVSLANNWFRQVAPRGMCFNSWNHLEVLNNTFVSLEASGLWSLSEHPTKSNFSFLDNTIITTSTSGGALHFGFQTDFEKLDVQIEGNRFDLPCQCDLQSRLRSDLKPRMGDVSEYSESWVSYLHESFYNSSQCMVTDVIARCFSDGDYGVGYMNITNFWHKVCAENSEIRCSAKDLIMHESDREVLDSRDKGYIFIFITSIMIVVILLVAITAYCKNWSDRNDHHNDAQSISHSIRKYFRYICHTSGNNNNNNNNNITEASTLPIDATGGTIITNSIDHLPGDLVEVGRRRKRRRKRRPRRRDMGVTVHDDLDLTDVTIGSSSESEAGTDRTCSTFDSLIPCEEKGTQTVPEPDDLTEELLKELKERLNDPNYYSEARDMIEHLYDLIKVEEKNSKQNTVNKKPTPPPTPPPKVIETTEYETEEEEDERYAVIQPPRNNPNLPGCSGVTRSKPLASNGNGPKNPALCEYMDPQDHRHHVYTELPSVTNRAVGFFRSLLPGGGGAGGRKKGASADEEAGVGPATVTEYMEPTDARVHVYTELATNSNMANRPLPEKPSYDDDSDSS